MHVNTGHHPRSVITRFLPHRCGVRGMTSAAMATAIVAASISLAPPAVADTAQSLSSAMSQVRSAKCGPLRSNPLLDEVAEIVNKSTDNWLNQDGIIVPITDPGPVLKDRGDDRKALLIQGAGETDVRAIKGLLLEGYLTIPDCAWTEFGVNAMRNRTTNYFLVATVLTV